MSDHRRLRISFEPTFNNVDMVRSAVRGVCADFFTLDENAPGIMNFCLIVSELMNNAVEHAASRVLDAEIILTEHEAIFRLISAGERFDPTPMAVMPEVEEGELPEGGYGLALIQALADSLEYEYRGRKNMVTLRKIFPQQPGKDE